MGLNPLHWSTHVKHLAITGGLCVTALFGFRAYKDMSVNLAQIEAGTRVKVAEDQKAAAEALQVKQSAAKAIVVNDAATGAKLADLQRQLDAKPDSSQVKSIIEAALPGVKTVQATDAQGKAVIAVEDTQENRDVINRTDVAFKSCKFSLDGCQQNTLQYKTALDADNVLIARKDSIIAEDEKEIKKLKTFGKGGNFWARTARVVIPAACGIGAAALASQGKLSSKGVLIAGGASAGVCALTFHF